MQSSQLRIIKIKIEQFNVCMHYISGLKSDISFACMSNNMLINMCKLNPR